MLVLRFIGVLNAAIWLGAAIFFTFAVGPAFFTNDVINLFHGAFWPGVMAQRILDRYFYLQQICGVMAVVHWIAEWFYLGRPLHRLHVALLGALLAIGFFGGFWLQPRLQKLHLVKYGMDASHRPATYPTAERLAAMKSFARWHGISMALNLCSLGGLAVYFWRVTHPSDDLRVLNAAATPQFRS
ncbi:MAG: hypothetical protein QOF48_758 [Verrucomicrobiota bacterium]|jgi:hypothetical protein